MKKPYIHKTAIVESINIGQNTNIWAYVHILKHAKIGKNVNICDHCFIENEVVIGDNVTIKCGVYLWDGIRIENNVMIGPNVTFTNDRYPRSQNKDWKKENTLLKKGSTIGANSTLLPGIVIGQYAMVGVASLVTKDVLDFSLVYGTPAKHRGYICICGIKIKTNKNTHTCSCGKKFSIRNSHVMLVA